jgi:hypothetical protein
MKLRVNILRKIKRQIEFWLEISDVCFKCGELADTTCENCHERFCWRHSTTGDDCDLCESCLNELSIAEKNHA